MVNLIKMMAGLRCRLHVARCRLKKKYNLSLLFKIGLATTALTVGVCLIATYVTQAAEFRVTENLTVPDGSVGIGTTGPTSKLEISGGTGYVVTGVESVNLEGPVDVNGAIALDKTTIYGPTQAQSTLTVGEDATGYDVKFYGTTEGVYMLWDESGDDLIVNGQVAIGTTDAPTVALDVTGQANISTGVNVGDAGGFSGMKFDAGNTHLTFWIDGSQVAHIAADGTYNDDVP